MSVDTHGSNEGAVWVMRLIWFIVCTLASIGAFIVGRLW